MPTFNNGESGASVRTKINDAITKVDGIESGADVTDTANVTAAGALMDSELTDEAAVKAIDQGLATTDSPSFVNLTGDLDLADIAETKGVTAVDVFVYDTSKDSDGGAWRKRTQGTSWYNETLNTATRGSRREFPAVAVIVAEADKVTIYDGDDPSLPMWWIINRANSSDGGKNFWRTTVNATSVAAKNGSVFFTLDAAGGTVPSGLCIVDFVADQVARRANGTNGGFGLDASSTPKTENLPNQFDLSVAILNAASNDCAVTVLPDAPIDPATGLPVPTIAVATDGGVSVIKDDGTVVDITGIAFQSVGFVGSTRIWGEVTPTVQYGEMPTSDVSYTAWRDGFYNNTTGIPYLRNSPTSGFADTSVGQDAGLSRFYENTSVPANGMVAYTTSTYNTGWMNGDIKGAFLSDTDDTDLVGSGELVTNGTFDTDSDWTKGTGWAISGGVASHTGGVFGRLTQTVTGVSGQKYVITADATYVSGGDLVLQVNGITLQTLSSGSGVFFATFTSAGSDLIDFSTGSGDWDIDNVSVKLADADRSVNNNGLIVNGTVTRDAVATGADLVAYSGFSASNYLEQPYNSDLDFGTGDFCVMGWLKQGANTAVETILERDSAVSAQRFTLAVNASGFLTFTCDDDTTARTSTSNRVVDNDVWTHFVALYDGAGDVKIYLNGVLDDTETGSALLTLNNASAVLNVGLAVDGAEPLTNADLALLRISATVPSDSQILKIYNDEKFLFQENAQATLYGSSDAVTALAHDPVTDLLHVGTSAGRSVFQGLRRVDNTTDAVGTAISASNNLIVEE